MANERRPWRIWSGLAQVLTARARKLYAGEDFGLDLDKTVPRPSTRRCQKEHRFSLAGVRCDQAIALGRLKPRQNFPHRLRRIGFVDPEQGRRLIFLTNNFELPVTTISVICKQRWQVELFFKWTRISFTLIESRPSC